MKSIRKRLFYTLSLMFVVFALIITLSNTMVLRQFFVWYEKGNMRNSAQNVLSIDLTDRNNAAAELEKIEGSTNSKIAIYYDDVLIYYTAVRRSDTFGGRDGFDIDAGDNVIWRGEFKSYRQETDGIGGVFTLLHDKANAGFMVYSLSQGKYQVDIITDLAVINNSAKVASTFGLVITGACLLCSLVWAIYYARRFSSPIREMNDIANDMANLDFSRKVEVKTKDEIGQLANSINHLSDSLDIAMRELNDRNARLENEIEQERRLDNMRREFVANVSHELKTPISIIQGYAEGIKSGVADTEKYTDIILDESVRMYNLVIKLLELSKVEGGLKINKADFDLASAILGAVDALSLELEQKNISLKLNIAEKLNVKGDEILITQAIRNYISNAISHTAEGGEISLSTENYKNGVRVLVFNSGSDIKEEEMADIWEPFYRSDKSHNRKEGRYGLGLSIVKAIMVAHEKDFGVFTTDNGVTFWLSLEV